MIPHPLRLGAIPDPKGHWASSCRDPFCCFLCRRSGTWRDTAPNASSELTVPRNRVAPLHHQPHRGHQQIIFRLLHLLQRPSRESSLLRSRCRSEIPKPPMGQLRTQAAASRQHALCMAGPSASR